ncbi:MAG: pyruvate kinase alpha/beta domain-containing protein [Candidatus Aminicenantales bacterium]
MKHTKPGSADETAVSCVYFRSPGPQNTRRALEIAAQRARELAVQKVLVASTRGETGLLAAQMISSAQVIVVTHATGFLRPDHQQLDPNLKKKIQEAGAHILTCQHALGGVGRAVRKKLGTYELEEIIAYTLRIFGEGIKVAVEIALMAADAGLVSTKAPCISVGGTGEGADAAVLLKPAHAQNFFDLRVMEILAKPRLNG